MDIQLADRDFSPSELHVDFFDSRFGRALIGVEPESSRIAWLSLIADKSAQRKKASLQEMKDHWKTDVLRQKTTSAHLDNHPGNWIFEKDGGKNLSLLMRGTDFQLDVWRELLKIPQGQTCSYSELAGALGRPATHARAVASAIAANHIAVLIPCHRVLRSNGDISGFRWGTARKRMLLDWEAASTQKAV